MNKLTDYYICSSFFKKSWEALNDHERYSGLMAELKAVLCHMGEKKLWQGGADDYLVVPPSGRHEGGFIVVRELEGSAPLREITWPLLLAPRNPDCQGLRVYWFWKKESTKPILLLVKPVHLKSDFESRDRDLEKKLLAMVSSVEE